MVLLLQNLIWMLYYNSCNLFFSLVELKWVFEFSQYCSRCMAVHVTASAHCHLAARIWHFEIYNSLRTTVYHWSPIWIMNECILCPVTFGTISFLLPDKLFLGVQFCRQIPAGSTSYAISFVKSNWISHIELYSSISFALYKLILVFVLILIPRKVYFYNNLIFPLHVDNINGSTIVVVFLCSFFNCPIKVPKWFLFSLLVKLQTKKRSIKKIPASMYKWEIMCS
jgi:hypothetical protein